MLVNLAPLVSTLGAATVIPTKAGRRCGGGHRDGGGGDDTVETAIRVADELRYRHGWDTNMTRRCLLFGGGSGSAVVISTVTSIVNYSSI